MGNVSQYDKSQGGVVYLTKGIAPTICAGTHGYALGYIISHCSLGTSTDSTMGMMVPCSGGRDIPGNSGKQLQGPCHRR